MFTPENMEKAKSVALAYARKAKAYAQGITELELKVQEATNEDKWGPHGSAMLEIARAAEDEANIPLIMGVIYARIKERDLEWRLCYKALLLSEFLIKKGPMNVVDEMVYEIWRFKQLQDFVFTDADKRDQGINVRQRASEIVNLLSSRDRIMAERQKARQTAEKYRGLSSDDVMRRGGGLGGYGSGHGSSGYSSGSIASTGFGGSPSGGAGNAGGHRAGSESHKLTGPGGGGNAHSKAPPVDEDPFEATRKRIELLRASGHPPSPLTGTAALQASEQQHSPVPGSIDMDASPNLFPEQNRAGPKKLSEVKVNPDIAAAFKGLKIAPPLASKPSTGTAPLPAIDLLEALDAPSLAAPTPAAQPSAQQPSPADLLDDLAGPTSAPAPQPAPAADLDEWGMLVSSSAPVPGPHSASTEPAAQHDASDPFAMLSSSGGPPPPSSQQDDGDFSPFVGAVPPPPSNPLGGPDPFSVPGAASSAAVQQQQRPMCVNSMLSSVLPPPSKDPFADLLS